MIRTLKYMNLLFFILMIGINALANTMPLGYGNTGAISNRYPNLFTPAPITFSIWGVIYILVAYFIAYQFGLFNSYIPGDSLVRLIGPWFILSCIMNIGWIFSWHYDQIWLSLIFMIGLLATLVLITINLSPLGIMRMTGKDSMPFMSRICVYAFDIYLGWICAATIANISVLLVKIEWTGFGLSEVFWTSCVLIAGAIIGILLIFTSQKYLSGFAIIWAYCGILVKHISPSGYGGLYPAIIIMAIVCIFAILTAAMAKAVLSFSGETIQV